MQISYRIIPLALLCLLLLGQSCGYKKRNALLMTPKKIKSKQAVLVINKSDTSAAIYRHRIKIGDKLELRFLNNYDIGGSAGKSPTSTANASAGAGYLVNYDSTVILPLLGRINLVGMTRLEAANFLELQYGKYVINPIIDLNISSLGVTVLGEVGVQGKMLLYKEKTTLIDIIALSGGIKETGRKHNIRIIRGDELIIVDLRKIEILDYPEMVMHDGDIVYVEPYPLKSSTEPALSITPILTLVFTGVSAILLFSQFYLIYNR